MLEGMLLDDDFPCLRSQLAIDVFLVIVLIGIALLLSTCINVNRFSMHALYANRLVRAFLGSARAGDRQPDPFTGFDPKDNLRLAQTEPAEVAGRQVVSCHQCDSERGVVAEPRLAGAQGGALHHDPALLRQSLCQLSPPPTYGGQDKGGLTLGTAMAISGAAVSPEPGI